MPTQATKPITYYYQGQDQHGRPISGELRCKNLTQAKIQLRKMGIQVQHIDRKRLTHRYLLRLLQQRPPQKIHRLDITLFTRQLATLIQAGVPLLQSLTMIADGLDKPRMQQLLFALRAHLEDGHELAASLAHYPQYFNPLYCALIQAGEHSGNLDIMLDRMARHLEKSQQLKMKIKKALSYPLFITIVAGIVSLILMLKVVPIFQDLFRSFAAELPLFTQLVLAISQWLQNNFWLVTTLCIGLPIISIYSYRRSPRLREMADQLSLKLPILGDLVYKSIIARYSRSLATSYAAGVTLIEALAYSAAATHHVIYQKAVMKIRDDVATGQALHLAMHSTGLFPNMVIQMVAIGEASGALDHMLDQVASRFEDEVDHAVDGLTALIEPLLMVVLAVLIGGLVIAMYLPIFKMGSIL